MYPSHYYTSLNPLVISQLRSEEKRTLYELSADYFEYATQSYSFQGYELNMGASTVAIKILRGGGKWVATFIDFELFTEGNLSFYHKLINQLLKHEVE